MIAAIVKEIALSPVQVPGGKIETLYLGGGTPSILDEGELAMLFDALHKKYAFADDTEISLEANPDDISPSKLLAWQHLGVNRLSVGIQSFFDEELQWMNRAHTAKESLTCIDLIRDLGFHNFSVDLIYGSPLLTDDHWKKNVETVIEKAVPHISCYALTVEPKTALHKMIALQKKEPVDTEKQARQFLSLMDWMGDAGYRHYEISNFARPGMQSRHNSSYWSGKAYIGFGPSAHSYHDKKRSWNIANNVLYIQSLKNNRLPFEEETLTIIQQLNEYIMTSLRTQDGLSLDRVSDNFGKEYTMQLMQRGQKWESGQKLQFENGRILLTKEGKLFADGIAADLFFE